MDEYVSPDAVTNDPKMTSTWHTPVISTPQAWDYSQGEGVVIAIVDSGVMPNHPDLSASLIPGWNVFSNNSDTTDGGGHGTATAGAAAAIGNNGIGLAGVAFRSKIMPVRITDSLGNGATFSLIASAIIWSGDHGADIASISYANLFKSSTVISAAKYLRSKGGITVVSANNNGINENVGNISDLIVVSGTDKYDAFWSTSSFGSMVDIAAPAVSIATTLNNGSYGVGTGTSFATPLVAGTLALMKAANPGLSPSEHESLLLANADDLGASGFDIYFGNGRLNAARSVAAAVAATPFVDTQAPSVEISSPVNSANVSGAVVVNTAASDNVGVIKVELRVNNRLIASDSTAPFSVSWDSTQDFNGPATLVATAFDQAGNSTSSSPITVNISNESDTVLPILSPASGAILSKGTTITVTANDNVMIAEVQVAIDGSIVRSVSGDSLTYNWNLRKVSSGVHTITATAIDTSGNRTVKTIQVTKK